jgi:hypothetical protein
MLVKRIAKCSTSMASTCTSSGLSLVDVLEHTNSGHYCEGQLFISKPPPNGSEMTSMPVNGLWLHAPSMAAFSGLPSVVIDASQPSHYRQQSFYDQPLLRPTLNAIQGFARYRLIGTVVKPRLEVKLARTKKLAGLTLPELA